jgi:hypothetical protein
MTTQVQVGQFWQSSTGAVYVVRELNAHGHALVRNVDDVRPGRVLSRPPLSLPLSQFDGRHLRHLPPCGPATDAPAL